MESKFTDAMLGELRRLIEDIEAARKPENEMLSLAVIGAVRDTIYERERRETANMLHRANRYDP